MVAVVTQMEPTVQEAVNFAQTFVTLGEQDRVECFYKLRRERRLSATVRGLNGLLTHPDHKELGLRALRSIGLEFAD
jgi:hypothetical protein